LSEKRVSVVRKTQLVFPSRRRCSALAAAEGLTPAGRHPVEGGAKEKDLVWAVGASEVGGLELALTEVEPLEHQTDLSRVRQAVDSAEAESMLLVDWQRGDPVPGSKSGAVVAVTRLKLPLRIQLIVQPLDRSQLPSGASITV
jgi:hypothetical protein